MEKSKCRPSQEAAHSPYQPARQPGDKLRLRGAGVKENSGRTGDQIVVLDLKVPKKPNGRYRELLEEMASIEREHAGTAPETSHGFWDKLKSFFD